MHSSMVLLFAPLLVANAGPFLAPRRLDSPEEVFQKYYDIVLRDAEVGKTISELLKWAEEEVQKNFNEIKTNLHKTSRQGSTFNLLWPGAGYSSISCGGHYEVLSRLEKAGMFTIGNIVGASGGATSGILALADANKSSRSLLFYYHVMELYKRTSGDDELTEIAPYLVKLYEHAILAQESFETVQQRYRAMAMCSNSIFGPLVGAVNTGFSDCATRQQCAQATQASGEASARAVIGDVIDGFDGHCRDGGIVRSLPSGPDNTFSDIFFNSYYGMDKVGTITLDSIKELFKAGVVDTISMLKSPKLQVPCTGECSKLAKVRAEVQLPVSPTKGACTQWYDLKSKSHVTTPSGCHV